MKKVKLSIGVFLIALMSTACGGEKKKDDKKSEEAKPETEVVEEAPVEVFEPFATEKLEGKWKVVEAAGYSRDKMKGQTYVFAGDSATIYKTWGEGGMGTGFYQITEGKLAVEFKTAGEDGSVSSMTTKYEGGFTPAGLVLTSASERIELVKE